MNKLFALVFAVVMSLPVFASDFDKEKRWADQVVDALIDGDELYLTSEDAEFLTIEMASESDNNTGVIVIHGMGVHPNWEQVVQPARIGLAESGYYTLSIQMPVLANDAEPKAYGDLMPAAALRIGSAVAYLKEQGMTNVVLVGHSLGTEMAAYYLAGLGGEVDTAVVAFVGVSMSASLTDYLDRISVPVLDLYGSDDYAESLKSVPVRKAASVHNEHYHQVAVIDANHFFDDKEAELLNEIKQFISDLD